MYDTKQLSKQFVWNPIIRLSIILIKTFINLTSRFPRSFVVNKGIKYDKSQTKMLKMKKKLIISIIHIFIGVLVLMWGCSADPMVAPVKVFIVGTGNDRGRVLYDDDYNARVIFLKVGEASVVKVVTNRFEEPKDLVWNSNTPSVATVTKKEGLEGLIRATGYGASMISVTLNSKESDAYSYGKGTCYVIVNDMAQDDGINIKFTNYPIFFTNAIAITIYPSSFFKYFFCFIFLIIIIN